MKTVKSACELQPNALEISVGNQIEQLDEIIRDTNGQDYFKKTFITDGMKALLTKGIARLASKSNDSIFHLKQAMGGGKTHLMVGFGLLAKDPYLREALVGYIPYQSEFEKAKVAAFNGRVHPDSYFWGDIAEQLGKAHLFREYWERGIKAPDEKAWLNLFDDDSPILILLDEMPPYFQYYSTQELGNGTVADVVTNAFSNMLSAAQKKSNVAIVVSDLDAAYETGGKLIKRALDDARQELGRAEVSITPVNLESNEIYDILRKRLFLSLPNQSEIADIAEVYAKRLAEAARAKAVERSAESLASEIESTYPFHPSFKNIIALFKENEKFRQTRGLMELVSRLLKSVWESDEDIYLIGAQHFDLSISEVREKLADISDMRDVISRDLWDTNHGAHAQIIDDKEGSNYAKQVGALLFTASLSTSFDAVKGLTESELLEYLIDPHHQASVYRKAFVELQKSAWYLHQTAEGRTYFNRNENLTKKLQGYAEKAPQNRIDELIRNKLLELYKPITKEAYDIVLPLPEMQAAADYLKTQRALLIISPDGKTPPSVVEKFFSELVNKNNLLILTGNKSIFGNVEISARQLYAVTKANEEINEVHPQRKELDEKKVQYEQQFLSTLNSVFDQVVFPRSAGGKDILTSKALELTHATNEKYDGEKQIITTLTKDPLKLYTDIQQNFDTLRSRAEDLLFGNQDEVRKSDLIDRNRQKTQMPWLPTSRGLDTLIQEACQRGVWEDLQNSYISKKPKPKTTEVIVTQTDSPDDEGYVNLKIDTINAGSNPIIHYAEDGEVTKNSPTLTDNKLRTNAVRVQFLAIDPTERNETGHPKNWVTEPVVRNRFDEINRTVELFVAPKGEIKYTLDGSEPRNGMTYASAISIGDEETTIYVFANCLGVEVKRNFPFPAKGKDEVALIKDKPAVMNANRPKRLENARAFDGLSLAKQKNISFENVTLTLMQESQSISVSFNLKMTAEKLEEQINAFRPLFPNDGNINITMTFRKANAHSGFDMDEFVKTLSIEVIATEIEQ